MQWKEKTNIWYEPYIGRFLDGDEGELYPFLLQGTIGMFSEWEKQSKAKGTCPAARMAVIEDRPTVRIPAINVAGAAPGPFHRAIVGTISFQSGIDCACKIREKTVNWVQYLDFDGNGNPIFPMDFSVKVM